MTYLDIRKGYDIKNLLATSFPTLQSPLENFTNILKGETPYGVADQTPDGRPFVKPHPYPLQWAHLVKELVTNFMKEKIRINRQMGYAAAPKADCQRYGRLRQIRFSQGLYPYP